ncbi:MAG: class I SAM-dependent methyltransferase [Planctomycetota bacterium]|nr:MAG: class I SAM-dependent methyltransferase [Planctomycetota bacterium]REJ92710.1 MAG: class I SAM-dependent methyltransferase [Planctomycetota bacterium]REK23748.1 MAG: class I SAM-dependent methyltransferase [Planctomycetota bacterium]REK47601.1 MAG: class I SAM-dependent methyltransferase [Planctomycetota bacterium]
MTETQRDWNQNYLDADTPWDSGGPSPHLEELLTRHAIAPGRALEIGCGSGNNALLLARLGFTVTAVDVAPHAIELARQKAREAGLEIDFRVADLLQSGCGREIAGGEPFPFVFDRGVYHCLRRDGVGPFLENLRDLIAAGGIYALLAGNANDPCEREIGPPQVHAHELTAELDPLFELIELRECRFHGLPIETPDGEEVLPLAWLAVLRRRAS